MDLLQVEKELLENFNIKKNLINEYDKNMKIIADKINNLQHLKDLMLKNYNIDKILNAKRIMDTKYVKKNYYGDAREQLLFAIKDVTEDFKQLRKEYIGCKNYECFSGQAVNCSYGRCPTHGSICFEIGINNEFREKEINDKDKSDILYFLNLLLDEKSREEVLKDNE